MSVVHEPEVKWSPDQMVEVTLNEPDDFLKVRETLTRIGVSSRKEKVLYQSCHILHKQGKYYIVCDSCNMRTYFDFKEIPQCKDN